MRTGARGAAGAAVGGPPASEAGAAAGPATGRQQESIQFGLEKEGAAELFVGMPACPAMELSAIYRCLIGNQNMLVAITSVN